MKKQILIISALILVISCKSLIEKEEISYRICLYHLGIVENFANVGYVDKDDSLNRSIFFLETLTNINCDIDTQYTMFYTPSKENLKNWKRWLKKNKEKLYWDEKEEKVKLRQ